MNQAVSTLPVISVDRNAFHIDVAKAVASVESRHGRLHHDSGQRSSDGDRDVKHSIQSSPPSLLCSLLGIFSHSTVCAFP